MTGDERRLFLLKTISNRTTPISASKLATITKVSRQVIVGDVALLRAQGHDIIATRRGYVMHYEDDRFIAKIAVNHTYEQTELELKTLVKLGIHIIDVTVGHPIYGELTGQLNIKNLDDVNDFIKELSSGKAELLSSLTQGIHLHTISCPDETIYNQALNALDKLGFIIKNQ